MKIATDHMNEWRAGAQRYRLHPEAEEFRLDADDMDDGPTNPHQYQPHDPISVDDTSSKNPLPWITAADLDELNEMIELEETKGTVI